MIKVHISCNIDNGIPEEFDNDYEYREGYIDENDIRMYYHGDDGDSTLIHFKADGDSIRVSENIDTVNSRIEKSKMVNISIN